MKRIRNILLVCMVLCVLLAETSGTVLAFQEQESIADQAGLMTYDQISQLAFLVGEVELSSGWDLMLVTTEDTGGKTAREYAEEWFDTYTVSDDGVICLIDMDNRELRICTFGKAIAYLPDSRTDEILDAAYYDASEEAYFEAFEHMVKGIDQALQRGIPDGLEIYDEDTREVIGRYREPKRISRLEFLLAFVAALAAGGVTAAAVIGRYRLKWGGGYQYSCRENGKIALSKKTDAFVNQIVTHRRIPKNTSRGGSSGSGSRSTTHIGAGGRRSGGGGRKF